MKIKLVTAFKGGSGSGNFGHSGRPGAVGGSGGGGAASPNEVSEEAQKFLFSAYYRQKKSRTLYEPIMFSSNEDTIISNLEKAGLTYIVKRGTFSYYTITAKGVEAAKLYQKGLK